MGCNYYLPSPRWRKGEKIGFVFHYILYTLVLPLWLPFIIFDLIFDFSGSRRRDKSVSLDEINNKLLQQQKRDFGRSIEPRKRKTEKSIIKCPACKTGYLIKRQGKYGKFLGCSNYPKCRFTINIRNRRAERYNRAWYLKNREQILAKLKKGLPKPRECPQCHKIFQPTTRAKIYCSKLCQNRYWREHNREKANESYKRGKKKYLERLKTEDPEKYRRLKRESKRRWRERHQEQYKSKHRFYKKRRKVREKGAIGSHTKAEWEKLKKKYDYHCAICGQKEPFRDQLYPYLTEDHITPISKGGTDNIDNIQPLCFNCNCKKRDLA